ncbi:peptidase domain-containing ABC transporter [Ruminococcus sp. Marseille-P6503]|uniref:peptidase domain-containing ABC transporter n=1 Tax=Ruminococcus sp. Marseille-P6503 TaxID=2364796 RepID=UPI000F52BDDE|nr:peptidase domain-containing ABC transporter [Ruminococcus sp. Marseille-P6503]
MKYYCVKQHDITDCGAACLATISKQYGLNLSISKIREVAGTDKQGTNAYGMIKAAEQLGFSAKGVKGDKEAFFTEFPLPAIAHVVVDGSLLHYVVIHKITKKQIIIADPGKGIVKYTPEEFFKIWTGVLILLVPTSKFQKGNENKGVLSRFFSLMFPQKRLLLNIFLSSLIITVFGILASFYFRFIMDDIVPNSLRKTLITLSIGVIVLYIFKAILEAFRNHLMLYLSQKLDIPLILGYYQHVLGLPMNFFGTRKVGEIVSRFMDASKIRDAISSATLSIMIDTLMAVVGGIVLFTQNHLLFGIAVIVIILYGVIVFAFNKPVKKINEKQMEDNSQVTSYLVETLNGIETVKAFHAEDKAQAKTDRLFVKLLKSVFKGGMITNAQQTLTGAVSAIGGTVILWAGVVSVLNGNMTLGSLLTFNALLAYFLDPVKNLINLQPTMQTAIVAAERLSEILDLELEKTADESRKLSPQSLNYPIKIENLDFRYGTRKLVLENINMSIGAGEKIALVGESGSGKTTLSKLLMNFYPWEKGEIFIGDYNLKDINLESLRNRIAYISQDIFLFSGTIRENLELGNEDATLEDIIEACKLSKADEFINKLPLRYETMLEENGANLSGGQKQRLAIARALLKKPDILIMDEATSNLDSITEKAIEKTINNLSKNITTIIIAHRLSTIMRCDKIFVMEQGKFIEQGTHQELIEKKGRYYSLWKDQLPDKTESAPEEKTMEEEQEQIPHLAYPVFVNPMM